MSGVVVVVRAVVNGSLDLTARAIVLQAFLFDLAKIDAFKKFTVQQQMNRARGARVIRRSKGTEHCDYVVTRVRIKANPNSWFGAARQTKLFDRVNGDI